MEMAMETETPMQTEVVRDARPREAQDKRPGSRALAGARLTSIGGESPGGLSEPVPPLLACVVAARASLRRPDTYVPIPLLCQV